VLGIGPIAVFATVEQLRQIRAAIDAWLDQRAKIAAAEVNAPTAVR
jgi:hypothetical protein